MGNKQNKINYHDKVSNETLETENGNHRIDNAALLLFNVSDSTLKEHEQQIIETFGGFRILLHTLISDGNIAMNTTKRQILYKLLSPSNYDPLISPFINKCTDIICNLVQQFSWSLMAKQNTFKPNDLEDTIAGIIFDYASINNLWIIPKEIGICDENKVTFNNQSVNMTSQSYYTSYIEGFKIDPTVIGKYCCSIKKSKNYRIGSEVYFGVINAENANISNNNLFITCIGYLELNDDYAYCFNLGGYYHKENRDPIGGAYNTNYSQTVCKDIDDTMNVYVTIQSNNKGLLDWAINNKIIGDKSLEIDIPENGLFFACSTASFESVAFQITEIKTPKHTVTFDIN